MAAGVDADNGRKVAWIGARWIGSVLDKRLPLPIRFLPYIFIFLYLFISFNIIEFISLKELYLIKEINLAWILEWTLLQSLASATISTLLGIPVGIASGYYGSRIARTYRILGLPVFMAPTVAVVLGFNWLYTIGILPQRLFYAPLGIILVHSYFNIPLTAVLVDSSLRGSASELIEYLSSLRLKPGKLALILVQLASPGILTAWLLSFIYSFIGLATPLMIPGAAYHYYTLEAWIYTLYYGFLGYRGLAALLAILQAIFLLTVSTLMLYTHKRLPRGELAEKTWFPPWKTRGKLVLEAYSGLMLLLLYAPLLGVFIESLTGPNGFTLEAYKRLLTGSLPLPPGANPLRSIVLSLVYALGTAIAATALALIVALGGSTRRVASMVPLVVSPVMAGMGAYIFLYKPLSGLIGDLSAILFIIIFLHTIAALPLSSRSIEVGLARLSNELLAYLSQLKISMLRLLITIARATGPALVASVLLASVVSLGEFGATLVVTDPRTWSLGVLAYELYSMGRVVKEASAAASLLLLLTMVFVFMVSRRVKEWF